MNRRDQEALRQLNSSISDHVPTEAWGSTVAIVIAVRPAVHLLGTGALFEVGGAHFVVTAGHVVEAAQRHRRAIAVSDAADSFVPIDGTWVSFETNTMDSAAGVFDVAVHRLRDEEVQRLRGKKFLRRENIDFTEPSDSAVFALFGFPGIWSEASRSSAELVRIKPLEYVTYRFQGVVDSLIGYDHKYHFLLGASPDQVSLSDGSKPVLTAQDGSPVSLPKGLNGISGCSVWSIGDLRIPVKAWAQRRPRVVAIETGVYQSSQAVRATRWAAVTTLIHRAFPELRPAIDVWTPD